MSLSNDSPIGVGSASPDIFLRFSFRRVDDGVLVFDAGTGETSLLPFDCPVALDFFRRRLAENAFGEYDLQTFISSVGYFKNC
jgi:alpha/beta superfamily hydrolase